MSFKNDRIPSRRNPIDEDSVAVDKDLYLQSFLSEQEAKLEAEATNAIEDEQMLNEEVREHLADLEAQRPVSPSPWAVREGIDYHQVAKARRILRSFLRRILPVIDEEIAIDARFRLETCSEWVCDSVTHIPYTNITLRMVVSHVTCGGLIPAEYMMKEVGHLVRDAVFGKGNTQSHQYQQYNVTKYDPHLKCPVDETVTAIAYRKEDLPTIISVIRKYVSEHPNRVVYHPFA